MPHLDDPHYTIDQFVADAGIVASDAVGIVGGILTLGFWTNKKGREGARKVKKIVVDQDKVE